MKTVRMIKLDEFVKSIKPSKETSEDDLDVIMSINQTVNPKMEEIVSSVNPEIQHMGELVHFLQRIEVLTTLKIDRRAMLLILFNISTYGDSIAYAYYLHRMCKPNSIVTGDVVNKELFTFGYLDNEDIRKMWELQKMSPDEMRELNTIHEDLFKIILTWQ